MIVGAGFEIPCCTVKPFTSVELCPSGFVTMMLCAPVGAVPKMLIFAVICVPELKAHEFTLIPAPKLQLAPETNLLPVRTTLRFAWFCVPAFGLAAVNTGADVVVTVIVRVLGLGSVIPALSVTVNETVYVPAVENVIVPGFASVLVAGDPPRNTHE